MIYSPSSDSDHFSFQYVVQVILVIFGYCSEEIPNNISVAMSYSQSCIWIITMEIAGIKISFSAEMKKMRLQVIIHLLYTDTGSNAITSGYRLFFVYMQTANKTIQAKETCLTSGYICVCLWMPSCQNISRSCWYILTCWCINRIDPFRRRYFQIRFLKWEHWYCDSNSTKLAPKCPTDNRSVWVQVMAWCRTGDEPLPEPMMNRFTDA